MSKLTYRVMGLALFAAMTSQANAANLLNTIFGPLQSFAAPGHLIIFPSGSITQAFFTAQKETVMLSFSAVCSTTGTGAQATKMKINVSGTTGSGVIYPTNQNSYVLCTAIGRDGGVDGRGTYTLVTGFEVNSGIHNLTVDVTPTNGGTSLISNLTIQVWE